MKPHLTDWYPGDVKPFRPGVYETDWGHVRRWYSRWTGTRWLPAAETWPAAQIEMEPSEWQAMPWRGLASDPTKSAERL